MDTITFVTGPLCFTDEHNHFSRSLIFDWVPDRRLTKNLSWFWVQNMSHKSDIRVKSWILPFSMKIGLSPNLKCVYLMQYRVWVLGYIYFILVYFYATWCVSVHPVESRNLAVVILQNLKVINELWQWTFENIIFHFIRSWFFWNKAYKTYTFQSFGLDPQYVHIDVDYVMLVRE